MFKNFHLVISKETFSQLPLETETDIQVIECSAPNLDTFLRLLKRVGGRYGWDRRPKYLDFSALTQRLQSKETRFFSIQKNSECIGYIFATKPDNSLLWSLTETIQGRKTIEIENFGLFNSATGTGYGASALQQVFSILLNNNDNVYLSSRSTNHKGVIPFYEANGMSMIHQEMLADDLVIEKNMPSKRYAVA